MTNVFNVISERLDDVPSIIEICKQLKLQGRNITAQVSVATFGWRFFRARVRKRQI